MLRELATEEGGFASALDADSEGEEGVLRLGPRRVHDRPWRKPASTATRRAALAAHWGVVPEGNWEGRNVLNVAGAAPAGELLERGRVALLAAREQRVRPGRDDKQLASWNGMALRALATRCAGARRSALRRGDAQRCRLHPRVAAAGRRPPVAHGAGWARPHARLRRGLRQRGRWAAGGLRGARRRRRSRSWPPRSSSVLSPTSGTTPAARCSTPAPSTSRPSRGPRSLLDSATPSANAVAADVLLRLALLTGEADYDRRARSILRAVAPALERQPSAFGRMLSAADRALSRAARRGHRRRPGEDDARPSCASAVARPYAPDLVIAPSIRDRRSPTGRSSRARCARDGTRHRLRLPRLRLRRTDRRSAAGRRAGERWLAASVASISRDRKLSRTRRAALSGFGSSSADRLPGAQRQPPADDRHAEARRRPAAAGRDRRRGLGSRVGVAIGRRAAAGDPAHPAGRHQSRCRARRPPGRRWRAARRR